MSYPQPGYPPPYSEAAQQGQPGYPPLGQPGYPSGQPGYPSGQPGYPPGQPGYPPGQPGYAAQPGYPPTQGGYPAPVSFQPQPGYAPPGGQQGYQPQPGYPPPGGYGQPIAQQPMGGPQQPQGPTGYGYKSAIMTPYQPQPGGWMSMPQGQPNIPPGLEYLTMIDQLLVHQKVELLEVFTGFETQNKYTIKNSVGQKVYYAVEDSDCLSRNCCGPLRPYDMKILDNFKTEIIHLNRPLACDSCCFPCCLQTMEVSSPPGTVIGTIEQEWSILTPQFVIKNAAGDVVMRIEGPFCTFSICGDVEFKVLSKDGATQVGKISKQWTGFLREAFTDADYFGITFPMDLDVKMKAVMLGACFLIDTMFFEKSGNTERDRPGMF